MPTKIYDVSNSSERPRHRGNGGALENSIVTLLKKHAEGSDCRFVNSIDKADILFTNDVYPSWTDNYPLRRVKRMDGVYWDIKDKERNEPLNKAAKNSDMVIFISEYSHQSYHNLYGQLGSQHNVVLNWCDEEKFYLPKTRVKENIIAAIASSWTREEKRFGEIIKLATKFPDVKFLLIGREKAAHLNNVKFLGEIESQKKVGQVLRQVKGFVNLSYRDAAPKVIAEAQCCGLPIFYANSGGVPELVTTGVKVPDYDCKTFRTQTPELDEKLLFDRFEKYLQILEYLSKTVRVYSGENRFRRMNILIDKYFRLIKGV